MESKSLVEVEQLALQKQRIYDTNPLIYLLRAMLAGMFIGFGVIVAFKTGNFFYLQGSPLTYPIAGLTFSVAIILIVYGSGDLSTRNTFYYTYTTLRNKMRWAKVRRLWAVSYLGNILGAFAFAALIYASGLFDDFIINAFLLDEAMDKTRVPTMELFFRGILCNWLICLAFFVPIKLKGDGAKLFTMVLCVFCFFILGYEHSIVNISIFAVSLVINEPGYSVTFSGVLHNLIPVTIGNMIGGAGMVGWMYYFANRPFSGGESEKEQEI